MADNIIIVLGQYLQNDGTLSLQCRERCFYAYTLYLKGEGKRFLLSGGKANPIPNVSEGQAMKKYLISLGINEEAIITEDNSRNTYENAKFSSAILKKLTYDNLILVSSSYHIYRWYFNPVRFFNWMFRLKVTPDACLDSMITTVKPYDSSKPSVFVIVENDKKLNEFVANNSDKNVFLKTINSSIKKGVLMKKIHLNDMDMLKKHLKSIYSLEEIKVVRI